MRSPVLSRGLTFALRDTRLVALAGLVTGVAASFSMAASENLSTTSEGGGRTTLESSLCTGAACIVTVAILIVSLVVALSMAVLIILAFNYRVSVAKDLPFGKRFLEMEAISPGVAAASFGVGSPIRLVMGVEI